MSEKSLMPVAISSNIFGFDIINIDLKILCA